MASLAGMFRRPTILFGLAILLLLYVLYSLGGQWQMDQDQRWNIVLLVGGTLYAGLIIYAVRGHLADRRLRRDMNKQARDQNTQAGPESQRDFARLEADFNQAFEELSDLCRDQGLFRGDGATRLPWVMVIGPPGTGKTTALEHSGLRFTPMGRRVQGIGGTRNCTWWFAQDAVVLDTAGRFATKEESREEWLAFLHLLRKRRRRRAIDSAIVQIGVEELLPLSRREQEEMALQLRERLDELTRHLGVSFPVHLVFAKADLIDGFSEFFASVSEQEQAQPFGFPLDPEALPNNDVAAAFSERFDALCDGLLGRTTRYMYSTVGREGQEAVLYFPAELRRHRDALAAFTQILVAPDRRGDRPLLSAVYLTSALQQGGALPGLRQGPGDPMPARGPMPARRPPPARPQKEATPFFLAGLFARVLRQAQNAARPNRAQQDRLRLQLQASTGAAALLCLAGGWASSYSYRADAAWLKKLREAVQTLRSGSDLRSTQITLGRLGEELQAQVSLGQLLRERPEGGDLAEAHRLAAQALRRRIDDQLLRPLRSVEENHLFKASTWEQNGPGEVFGNGYRALQADLILRRGPCAETSLLERQQIIVDYVDSLWWQELGDKTRSPEAAQIRADLRLMLNLFFRQYLKAPDQTTALLAEGARQGEARSQLSEGSSTLNHGLVFNLIASGNGLYVGDQQLRGDIFADQGIQAVFTRSGCRTFFDKDSSKGKAWWSCVLGVKAERRLDLGKEEMEGYYVEQYQHAWRDWMGSIQLKPAINPRRAKESLESVSRMLQLLARGEDSELEQLLRIVGQGLDPEQRKRELMAKSGEEQGWFGSCMARFRSERAAATKQVDKLTAPACEQAARPYGIFARAIDKDGKGDLPASFQDYVKKVRALDRQLQHLRRSTDGAADALVLVLNTMKDSGELRDLAAARRELMYGLQQTPQATDPGGLGQALERLDSVAWSSLVSMSVEALNDQWNSAVYQKWKDLHTQAQRDPTFCPKVIDFAKQELDSQASKNILPFFKDGTCDPKIPAEPFNRPLMNFNPGFCEALRNVLALAQAKCPEGGAAPAAPAEPEMGRELLNAGYQVSKLPYCQNKVVQTVRLESGTAVYECNTSHGGCNPLQPSPAPRPTQIAVIVSNAGKIVLKTSSESSTLDDLAHKYRGFWKSDSQLHLFLDAASVGGGCDDLEVVLDFRPRPRKAAPKGPPEDHRWRTLDLPPKIASLPKLDIQTKPEQRKGAP